MIAVDTNILVYAHRREPREHPVALSVLRHLATGSSPWAIPWPCVYEFFGVVTNARVWKDDATSPERASTQLDAWFRDPAVRLLNEPPGFVDILGEIVRRPRIRGARIRGALVHDARVAAICVAHGVTTLLTRDRDFSLFPELTTRDPFAS